MMLLAFLLRAGVGYGLDPSKRLTQYVHDRWSTDDGLPESLVQAIAQTPDGYLWLGTQAGLARFDGVDFTVFDRTNVPALESDNIRILFVDASGVLWIGTLGGGLYDFADGVLTPKGAPVIPRTAMISAIAQDTRGDLLVGTSRHGLFRLHDGSFARLTKADGFQGGAVTAIHADPDGGIWIAVRDAGLTRLKDGMATTYGRKSGLPDDLVTSIMRTRSGVLWVGTLGGGACRLAGDRFACLAVGRSPTSNQVWDMLEDRDGNLWIATDGDGLRRFGAGASSSIVASSKALPNASVMALAEDREGSLWMGTVGDGLHRLRDGLFTPFGVPEGLPAALPFPILEDGRGKLWIGTLGGGLVELTGNQVHVMTAKQGLSSNSITSLAKDRHGGVWVGTNGGGLNHLGDGKTTHFSTANGLSNDVVISILKTRDGALWVGTIHGLNRIEDGKVTVYGEKDGLPPGSVVALYEDSSGDLWAGVAGGGLVRFHNGSFSALGVKDGLCSPLVMALCGDSDRPGVLWVATFGGGLSRYEDGRATCFTRREGLPSDSLFQILDDGRGSLWISSVRGIFRVSKEVLARFAEGKERRIPVVTYNTLDGMRSAECNGAVQPAGWRTSDGRLWFPTTKGVVTVDPARIRTNRIPPSVVVERVLAEGEELPLGRPLRLGPGRTDLEIHYAALSLLIPKRVRYKYRLQGFDDRWINAGNRRTAYYTKVPPGRYVFRVIACNNDGVWNDKGATVRILVKPHLFQMRWLQILLGLLVAAAAVGAYRLRVRRLKARQVRLAQLVKERTRQLEEANQKLADLSFIDGLTGLANRRCFDDTLNREWRRSAREGTALALLMIDIDRFKLYNDAFGHVTGDDALKSIAHAIQQVLHRPQDVAARYGGEEFAVILPQTLLSGARVVAERARTAVERLELRHAPQAGIPRLTISVGVASVLPTQEIPCSALVEAADKALYLAKKTGRNAVASSDA